MKTFTPRWWLTAASLIVGMMLVGGCERTVQPVEIVAQKGIVGSDGLPESVQIVTDPQTKCQYLMVYSYSLTPRLGVGGKPLCENTKIQ